MALAGEFVQPGGPSQAALTRITNRVIRIGHRLIGFGVVPSGSEPDGGGLEQYRQPALPDAAAWAEMATEVRLRQISQQAARL